MPAPAIIAKAAGTPPVNTVAPVASGLVVIGGSLSTTDGTWTGAPAPTFTYQWRRAGVNIGAATANTYTPVAADIGPAIDCVVTATNPVGNASQDSNDLTYSPVTAANIIEAWDPSLLTPGVITTETGIRAGTVLTNTGTVTASATAINGTPGWTVVSAKMQGAINLSAFQALCMLEAVLDTQTTVTGIYGYKTPIAAAGGFSCLVNDAGGGVLEPLTSGAGAFGGVKNGTETLASPVQLTICHDTALANGIRFVRIAGSAIATSDVATGCTAGNFANAQISYGKDQDIGVAWAGTYGWRIIMSVNSVNNDLLSAEAFIKFKTGL